MVPVSFFWLDALLLRRDDVHRQDRQHGAVHRHRDADLIERQAVEQDAHVEDAVDGHASHSDIAQHARIVAVVAAMGRQVEGDAEALLTHRHVVLEEGVGSLGGGESGVLPDRPGARHIHRAVWAADEGREAREGVEMVAPRTISAGIERLDPDAFRGLPGQVGKRLLRGVLGIVPPLLQAGLGALLREWFFGEVGDAAHDCASSARRRDHKVSRTSHLNIDEPVDAGGAIGGLGLPRMAGEDHGACSGRFQLRRQLRHHRGVLLVGGADHRDLGAARGKRRSRFGSIGLRLAAEHLEASGLEEVAGIVLPRHLLGDAANTGQIDPRTVAVSALEDVSSVAQFLERFVVGMHREGRHDGRLGAGRYQLFGDLAERGAGLCRDDRGGRQQAAPGWRASQRIERRGASVLASPVRKPLRRGHGELSIVRQLLLGALFGQRRVLADAGHHDLAHRNVLLTRCLGRLDLLAHPAAGEGPDHAALRLNLLEQRPGALGDFVAIPLDVPGAAGRINHLCQMAFLREDVLRIARVAAAGLGRQARGRVKRRGGDDVGAGHRARVASHRVAQDVEQLIARGQHPPAGGDAQAHPLGIGTAAARLDHVGPELARGADLRDGEIEAAAERHAESDLARCCLQIEPGGGQHPQIVEPGGHCECDIGDGRRAGVVVRRRADLDRGHARCFLGGPGGQVGHLLQRGIQRHRQMAIAGQYPQRIGVEAAEQLGERHTGLPGGGDIEAGRGYEGRAGIEVEARDIELHSLNETLDVGDGGNADAIAPSQLRSAAVIGIQALHGRAVEPQLYGGHAAIEILEDLRVGNGRIGMCVFLADVPAGQRIAQRPRAANERRIARQAAWIAGSRENLLGIEPLQLDAFVAAGKHALVEGCTLEVRFDLLSPRRVIDLGEVGSELELFRNRDHTVSPYWSEIVTVIGQRFHPADGDTNPDVSINMNIAVSSCWASGLISANSKRPIVMPKN